MITVFGKTFYWPGERELRQGLLTHQLALKTYERALDAATTRHQADLARLTDEVLKAKGLYAGPLHGYTPADGTGYLIPTESTPGFRVTRQQESMHGFRGMIRLTAEIEAVDIDLGRLMEARHIEWDGIKWKAGGASLERNHDIRYLGDMGVSWTTVTIPLEAFIEHVRPGAL